MKLFVVVLAFLAFGASASPQGGLLGSVVTTVDVDVQTTVNVVVEAVASLLAPLNTVVTEDVNNIIGANTPTLIISLLFELVGDADAIIATAITAVFRIVASLELLKPGSTVSVAAEISAVGIALSQIIIAVALSAASNLNDAINAAAAAIQRLANIVEDTLLFANGVVTVAIATVIATLLPILQTVVYAAEEVIAGVQFAVSQILVAVTSSVVPALSVLDTATNQLASEVSGLVNGILNDVETAISGISGALTGVVGGLPAAVSSILG